MATFTVDGQEYTLAFRMAALKAYQRATGETAVAAFQAIESDPGDMVRVSALFLAACVPAVSEDEADALMDGLGIGEAVRLLGEAAQAMSASPNSGAPADQA